MMNLCIDNIIFSLQKTGGISVVWYELIKRLLNSNEILNLKFVDSLSLENIHRKKILIPSNLILFSSKYICKICERYLSVRINTNQSFIFHSSYYRTCKNRNSINIVTVHDFTYEYYNKGLKKWIHQWQKYNAIRRADYIICVSNNTKKDLLKFLPDVNEHRIEVVYNGVSEEYGALPKHLLRKLPYCNSKYILFVGSRAIYKNFFLAAEAVSQTNLKFIIVGTLLNKKEIEKMDQYFNNRDQYYCTGRISNEELNLLYNQAFALLYPSMYEGFGIPVLEAQKSGCPVIAYNSSSIPEIIGDTPTLMSVPSSNEIIRCINLLKDQDVRLKVIVTGFENVQRFSWDNMYCGVINVYKKAWELKNK